jgi:antitoxin (DNA-binding transcriptional repressor) of toxin-antitoxin stability system
MQQLKTQPDRIFGKIRKGQELAVSYKGKICAKIVPFNVDLANVIKSIPFKISVVSYMELVQEMRNKKELALLKKLLYLSL